MPSRPARSPYLVTAPTPSQRRYDMVVALRVRVPSRTGLTPWIRITADTERDEVTLSCGWRPDVPKGEFR